MPYYRVQLKQGRRTITNKIHAKSVQHCKMFFEELTTMKVTEILEVKYQSDTQVPIDDFNYNSICKMIIKNNDNKMSFQVVLNNVKTTKSEKEIYASCLAHLLVGGGRVDSIVTTLLKK